MKKRKKRKESWNCSNPEELVLLNYPDTTSLFFLCHLLATAVPAVICTVSQHEMSIVSIELLDMGFAGMAPKVQGVGPGVSGLRAG